MLTFNTSSWATLGSASYLDGVSQFSVFVRARWNASPIVAGTKYYIFSHRNGSTGDQMSLRKDSSGGDKIRASVTAGGVAVTRDSTAAVTSGAIFNIGMTWVKNTAAPNGLVLFFDGVADTNGSGATTTQTGDYTTGGGSINLGSRDGGSDKMDGASEWLSIFPGVILTAAQFVMLGKGIWPQFIGAGKPPIFFPMFPQLTTRITDWSGNDRNIESGGITGTLSGGGLLGQVQDFAPQSAAVSKAATGGATPNPWTLDQEIPATPATGLPAAATILGLSNGTIYQFKVTAVDNDGLESSDSNVVEATPAAPAPGPSTSLAPWKRQRRFSKYRPSQQ